MGEDSPTETRASRGLKSDQCERDVPTLTRSWWGVLGLNQCPLLVE